MSNFDLVVIGAGPGGYVAAIKAAQLGLKTAIIEREHLGGICLNWGCIPTKALLRSAEIYRNIKHAESYGLSVKDASYDLAKIIERSRGVSKQLSSGIGSLLKKNKIETIMGTGKLLGNSKVEIKTQDGKSQTLTAKHIIVATGARARVLKGLEPDGKNIWSYKEALVADRVPKKLVVLGSGAIGIEFASFFNTLGSKTTVIEMLSTVMPVEDKEISEIAKKSFQNQGMEILTSTKLLSATNSTAIH
jgi:dihydrolipoamide dehydrogenase